MPDLLTIYASTQPDKPAVIDDQGSAGIVSWTYAQLEAEANRLANALMSVGVGPGQKVIWCGPNSPQVVAVTNATRKIGAVAVPLNYRLTPEEAQYIVVHSDASAAYVDATCAHLFVTPGGEQLGNVRHVMVFGGDPLAGMLSDDLVTAASAEPPPEAEEESLVATMIYTSGTTGKPKGAYRSMTDPSTAIALIGFIGYTPDHVYLTSGPLYHSGPSAFMSVGLALGQTIIMPPKIELLGWLRLVVTQHVNLTFSASPRIGLGCALPSEVKDRNDASSVNVMPANP